MRKGIAYRALAREIEQWRSMAPQELVAKVGKSAFVTHETVDDEYISIEITVHWSDEDRSAVRIVGVANGPSHWRLERLQESIVVSVT